MDRTGTAANVPAMRSRAAPLERRWPKLLIGVVLLWRALCVFAVATSANPADFRVVSELSSPGLSRSIKLVFASHGGDASLVIPRLPAPSA
jgi:hypothetical protein